GSAGRSPGAAPQSGPHRHLPPHRRADARRHRLAQPLRTVLVRSTVPLVRFSGGRRVMAVDTAVKPSLTVKRHLKAPPAKVFAAWTDPEKIKRWMGPGEIVAQRVDAAARVGGRPRPDTRDPPSQGPRFGGRA